MSKIFSSLRCASLYLCIIILASLYTVEILANPIAPTAVQKRQVVITQTQTYTTSAKNVVTITNPGKQTIETYKPAKPKNCAGPLKFSKVEVSASNNFISFIAKGKSSVDINEATVRASIYWDGRRSIDYKSECPIAPLNSTSDSCEINGDRQDITFNYTTYPLPPEFSNDRVAGRSAYFTLSVIDADGNVLGCASTSFIGDFTNVIPYIFNIPILCGAVSAVVCIAIVKRRKKDDCDIMDNLKPDRTPKAHLSPKDASGLDPHGNISPKDTSGLDPHGHLSPSSKVDPYGNMSPKDTSELDPHGHLSPNSKVDPYGNMSPKDTSGLDPHGHLSPNSKVDPYGNMSPSSKVDPHGHIPPSSKGDPSGNMPPSSQDAPCPDPSGNAQSPQSAPGLDPSGNKTSGSEGMPGLDPSGKPNPIGGIPKKSVQPPSQAPSVYDIIRAAQFFVTTALISLPGLPYGYRDAAAKLGWAMGLPSNLSVIFKITYLSKVADDQIRRAICHMTDFCSVLIKSPVAYNKDSACIQGEDWQIPTPPINATGFTSFGKHLQVPDYNLFFVIVIAFCSAVGVALVIATLIWLFALLCKHYWKFLWNKWSFLEKVTKDVHYLMLGGMLRTLILFYYPITLFAVYQLSLIKDCWLFLFLAAICLMSFSLGIMIFCGYKILRVLFHSPGDFETAPYTLLYGSLYTQYRDDSDDKETCIWFFVITIAYDFLRAFIIGLSQRSAIAQIVGLLVTEMILFVLLVIYKPFKTPLMNYLKISISVVQFVIVILLIPFLGDTSLLYRLIIDMIMRSLQFILTILIVGFTIVTLVIVIRNLINESKKKNDEEEADDNEKID